MRVKILESFYSGELPEGCKLCLRGRKSVVFITGVCNIRCFYCPISLERRGKDIIFVNDVEVRSEDDVLKEVEECGSWGAAFTGGEPALVPERLLRLSKSLKDAFGEEFHIHAYFHARNVSKELLEYCRYIDEIRIHSLNVEELEKAADKLVEAKADVGVEVPVIPGMLNVYRRILELVDRHRKLTFLNLNELEITETNAEELKKRGLKRDPNSLYAVLGSREEAEKVFELAEEMGFNKTIHFCASQTKDFIQFRLRTYSKLAVTAEPHETVTDDATAKKLLIVPQRAQEDVARLLLKHVPKALVKEVEEGFETCLTCIPPQALKEIKKVAKLYIVEETILGGRRFEVSRTPLEAVLERRKRRFLGV